MPLLLRVQGLGSFCWYAFPEIGDKMFLRVNRYFVARVSNAEVLHLGLTRGKERAFNY